jgi:hypothetical protein
VSDARPRLGPIYASSAPRAWRPVHASPLVSKSAMSLARPSSPFAPTAKWGAVIVKFAAPLKAAVGTFACSVTRSRRKRKKMLNLTIELSRTKSGQIRARVRQENVYGSNLLASRSITNVESARDAIKHIARSYFSGVEVAIAITLDDGLRAEK